MYPWPSLVIDISRLLSHASSQETYPYVKPAHGSQMRRKNSLNPPSALEQSLQPSYASNGNLLLLCKDRICINQAHERAKAEGARLVLGWGFQLIGVLHCRGASSPLSNKIPIYPIFYLLCKTIPMMRILLLMLGHLSEALARPSHFLLGVDIGVPPFYGSCL